MVAVEERGLPIVPLLTSKNVSINFFLHYFIMLHVSSVPTYVLFELPSFFVMFYVLHI